MTEANLKPCPYCGKHAIIAIGVDGGIDHESSALLHYYDIGCPDEACIGSCRGHRFRDRAVAIERWNRRAQDD
jgi:hypothetical protein